MASASILGVSLNLIALTQNNHNGKESELIKVEIKYGTIKTHGKIYCTQIQTMTKKFQKVHFL